MPCLSEIIGLEISFLNQSPKPCVPGSRATALCPFKQGTLVTILYLPVDFTLTHPKGIFVHMGRRFWVPQPGRRRLLWAEARNATKRPIMARSAPTTKVHPVPTASSVYTHGER